MSRIFGFAAILRLLVVLVVITGLGGCGVSSLSSLYKISQVDLATTDIAQMRFAVQLPNHVLARLQNAELVMRLYATPTEPELSEHFILQFVDIVPGKAGFAAFQRPNTAIRVYRIAAGDIGRFNSIRSKRDNKGRKRQGAMEVGALLCVTAGDSDQPVLVSTFLKAEEIGEFVPLSLNFDMTKTLRDRAKHLPTC